MQFAKISEIKTDMTVQSIFDNYPANVRDKMQALRELILETAEQTDGIGPVEETLRWGEPSYVTKSGSTFRIDWKENAPEQYAMYFQCTSRLVPTFKLVFDDLFSYEGNRAIIVGLDDDLPVEELRQCIIAALRYHKVKKHPTLEF